LYGLDAAATRTIVEGDIGRKGKPSTSQLKSAVNAKQSVEQQIAKKIQHGFIEYSTTAFPFRRKHRFAIKLIRKSLEEFEKDRGYRICEDFRNYILTVNGGQLEEGSYVSAPGLPGIRKVDVYEILGFKAGQPAYKIDYCSATLKFADGHTLFASGKEEFTIDQNGVVHMPYGWLLDRRDCDDNNVIHMDWLPTYVAAHSLAEFLTRIQKFPNDVSGKKKVAQPTSKRTPDASQRQVKAREASAKLTYRRFFYDDGELRKFWNIETQGKKFTTYYGRLGGRGSDTTKTFASEEACRMASDKTIGQKVKKGYQEVVADALKVTRPPNLKRAHPQPSRNWENNSASLFPRTIVGFWRLRTAAIRNRGLW
jgi:predicted DNA-binding WGR domain protein